MNLDEHVDSYNLNPSAVESYNLNPSAVCYVVVKSSSVGSLTVGSLM